MREELERMAALLNRNGFHASVVESGERAAEVGLQLIPAGDSVGFGGSMTVQQLGLYERLGERGHAVHWHWKAEQPSQARREAAVADWYLCSTNALTENGCFVNIDGTGNRVAAIACGPANMLLIVGSNKLVGSYGDAIQRIKNQACPQNARRLGLNTPCAVTGKCNDCRSKQRMCNVTGILQRPTVGRQVYVLLVDEEMGF